MCKLANFLPSGEVNGHEKGNCIKFTVESHKCAVL